MFIGHFAVGLASKRVAPRTSLGALVAAALLADLLWPVLILLGWEIVEIHRCKTGFLAFDFVSCPISHSLLATLVSAGLFAALYRWRAGHARGTLWLGIGVASHWVLDAASHLRDVPHYPRGPRVGLGLWSSVAGTLAVEGVMLAAGLRLYLAATRARNRAGAWALCPLLALILYFHLGSTGGSPPASDKASALLALGGWLLILWFYWVDRNREPRPGLTAVPA